MGAVYLLIGVMQIRWKGNNINICLLMLSIFAKHEILSLDLKLLGFFLEIYFKIYGRDVGMCLTIFCRTIIIKIIINVYIP